MAFCRVHMGVLFSKPSFTACQQLTTLSKPETKIADEYKVAKYQLLYFDLRARAQPIRYLCVDNNVDLEDVVPFTDRDTWENVVKPTTPFGQIPVLKDGDFDVAQSNAILRYLARKHGVHPVDARDCAKADMVNDHVEDIRVAYSVLIYQNYEAGKEEYISKKISLFFKPLEKLLKGWGKEFVLEKICFADYNLYDILDIHEVLAPGCLDAYPTLKTYRERITKRPKILELRMTENFKRLNINYNGKQ